MNGRSRAAQREIAVGALVELVEQHEDEAALVTVDGEAAKTSGSSVCTAASGVQHTLVSVRLSLSTTKTSHSLPSGSLTQALS